jgi:hypothetical protein
MSENVTDETSSAGLPEAGSEPESPSQPGASSPDEILFPGCGLFFAWLFASILGSAGGWALGWRISTLAARLLPAEGWGEQAGAWLEGGFSTFVLGAVVGLLLGALQGLVLRPHFSKVGQLGSAAVWLVATTLGWGGGFAVGAYLAQRSELVEAAFGAATGVAVGASLGVLQWLVLRRHFSRAALWIPVSIFAWGASLVYYQPGAVWLGLLYGTLSGLVSGIAILWLVYRPIHG